MEERPMAVGMIMNVPGVTQEQYDTVMEQLNLGGRMPPGGISHAAGRQVEETAETLSEGPEEFYGSSLD
jgi:hypothetical protein